MSIKSEPLGPAVCTTIKPPQSSKTSGVATLVISPQRPGSICKILSLGHKKLGPMFGILYV